ncbi:MAG TPA: helix-hairpin-helix domain-containing protein, partial [Gemmataceae bacterium]|nr:helix-hairpin-helix domain-containing protein [Gemmataceae bacterium]
PAQPTGEGQPPIATDQPAPPAPEAKPAPPPPPTINLEGLPEAPVDLAYVIVNEAGASDYSVSPLAREEFPDITDPALRGTASIGRRLQDPLSELVKIDPQHVGVGLYQHDVSSKHLKEMLEGVIESCVNTVGVDVNTASVPLLRHVSGMNQLVAHDLVEYRKANGPFRERSQLMQVNGIGEARFTQAAGFLKIAGGDNPLDRTWIHPESYGAANQLLAELGCGPEVLNDRERIAELRGKLRGIAPDEVAARLNVGTPTLRDIIEALSRPGRDPREDLPPPVFKKGVLKLEDLQPAMELKGTVLNVVDFGAFVDIGLKDSGLVHISQMANRYVKSPYDVVAVGDVVTVWVLSVDSNRRRVSLTMIRPGTERKPPERRPPSREPREQGPPRERGRGQRPQGQQTQQAQQGQQGQQGQEQRQGQGPGRGGQSRPAPAQAEGQTGETAGAQPAAGAAPQQGQTPPPPPRKPRRQPPKPQLSQAALAGSTPLGTFAELAAYWEAAAKPAQEKTPPPPPAEPEPPKEEQQAPPPENG